MCPLSNVVRVEYSRCVLGPCEPSQGLPTSSARETWLACGGLAQEAVDTKVGIGGQISYFDEDKFAHLGIVLTKRVERLRQLRMVAEGRQRIVIKIFLFHNPRQLHDLREWKAPLPNPNEGFFNGFFVQTRARCSVQRQQSPGETQDDDEHVGPHCVFFFFF